MPHQPATPPAEAAGPRSAVINPYALAELVAGRRIDWKQQPNRRALLEELLATPYEELFDPKYGGPLYFGLERTENGLRPARSPLLDVDFSKRDNDQDATEDDLSEIRSLKDLSRILKLEDPSRLSVLCADWRRSALRLVLALPPEIRTRQLARHFSKELLQTVAHDPTLKVGNNQDWTPPNATWSDGGRFFQETAEFFDPVQGAVANCYFIAALSAVAWAMPKTIAQLTRATGPAQDDFVDAIRFCKPDSGGQLDREIEVTEAVPKTSWGQFIYCRSSEPGECWPAIYEKAFAKLKTGTTTDHPDITATGWGDCVWATAQLTGGARAYYDTAGRSADQLWTLLRSNCLSYRTFRPMTAWTYGSGDDAPDKVDYATANVVGSHCYTVLGWAYANCRRYIVLRNPWGSTEATAAALDDTIYMYDISWWRPITLKDNDGTFAMEIGAFKRYFAGFGVVT